MIVIFFVRFSKKEKENMNYFFMVSSHPAVEIPEEEVSGEVYLLSEEGRGEYRTCTLCVPVETKMNQGLEAW